MSTERKFSRARLIYTEIRCSLSPYQLAALIFNNENIKYFPNIFQFQMHKLNLRRSQRCNEIRNDETELSNETEVSDDTIRRNKSPKSFTEVEIITELDDIELPQISMLTTKRKRFPKRKCSCVGCSGMILFCYIALFITF